MTNPTAAEILEQLVFGTDSHLAKQHFARSLNGREVTWSLSFVKAQQINWNIPQDAIMVTMNDGQFSSRDDCPRSVLAFCNARDATPLSLLSTNSTVTVTGLIEISDSDKYGVNTTTIYLKQASVHGATVDRLAAIDRLIHKQDQLLKNLVEITDALKLAIQKISE